MKSVALSVGCVSMVETGKLNQGKLFDRSIHSTESTGSKAFVVRYSRLEPFEHHSMFSLALDCSRLFKLLLLSLPRLNEIRSHATLSLSGCLMFIVLQTFFSPANMWLSLYLEIKNGLDHAPSSVMPSTSNPQICWFS